jgi:nitric oxide reductase large subunit
MMEGADRFAVGRTVVGEEQRAQPLVLGLVLASLSLIARAAVISRHENDNRLLELVVFLATIAAAIGYLSQLGPSTGEVANIALAEIFPRQQVVRFERERLVVIVEALVDLASLRVL